MRARTPSAAKIGSVFFVQSTCRTTAILGEHGHTSAWCIATGLQMRLYRPPRQQARCPRSRQTAILPDDRPSRLPAAAQPATRHEGEPPNQSCSWAGMVGSSPACLPQRSSSRYAKLASNLDSNLRLCSGSSAFVCPGSLTSPASSSVQNRFTGHAIGPLKCSR